MLPKVERAPASSRDDSRRGATQSGCPGRVVERAGTRSNTTGDRRPPHEHRCSRCGYAWTCEAPMKPKAKRCIVDVAAAVNASGPFCTLCLHLIMAVRMGRARGLTV